MSARRALITALAAVLAVGAAGCTNPDAPLAKESVTGQPQNAGEPAAPPRPTATSQAPSELQPTAPDALQAFARLYINWSYRNLTATQRTLANISVGAARLAEQQAAAASAADSTIQRAHVENSGAVISIARDQAQPRLWVIVTREQTSGTSQYEGLPAAYQVTLAHLQQLPGGWAVDEWLPQS